MSGIAAATLTKILCVDDEDNILRSLKRLFLEEGFDVVTSNDAKQALELLKNDPEIGLVLSDQKMPGLTGVDFLEQVKKISPDAIRIMLTGYADINASIDAINRGGAYRYITKPWRDEKLIQIIKEAARTYSLSRENKRLAQVIQEKNNELEGWNDQLQVMVQKQTVELQQKNDSLETLNKRLKSNIRNTIIAFAELLELREKGPESHSRNVTEVSVSMAKAMGLSNEALETISVASLLHDIGKIGISDILLHKNREEMSEEEFKEYKLHAARGQTAMDSIEDLRTAGLLIRHHHENYDGTGFPDKLKGQDQIPLGSRIIAVADFIDWTIRNRRDEDRVAFALNKVKEESGRMFDPQLHPLLAERIPEIYIHHLPKSEVMENELGLEDLKPGMMVSRDVRSGNGVLLLRKGMKLSDPCIQVLKRKSKQDPSREGVFVLARR